MLNHLKTDIKDAPCGFTNLLRKLLTALSSYYFLTFYSALHCLASVLMSEQDFNRAQCIFTSVQSGSFISCLYSTPELKNSFYFKVGLLQTYNLAPLGTIQQHGTASGSRKVRKLICLPLYR